MNLYLCSSCLDLVDLRVKASHQTFACQVRCFGRWLNALSCTNIYRRQHSLVQSYNKCGRNLFFPLHFQILPCSLMPTSPYPLRHWVSDLNKVTVPLLLSLGSAPLPLWPWENCFSSCRLPLLWLEDNCFLPMRKFRLSAVKHRLDFKKDVVLILGNTPAFKAYVCGWTWCHSY